MKRFAVATGAILLLNLGCVHAAAFLSERQARAKAIDILKGDPYGRTRVEVAKNIRKIRLAINGNTKACGALRIPAWDVHVTIVTANKDQFNSGIIDGFLALDARTGKFLCANLPFLD